ncbi:MAG: ATP-binding cassette domain-containing protein [Bacteroidia bacterium]|nr:ATP-binding cassette domain-containing protein [Bacteroidia bacterium]MCX7652391.1 ATP-binding cassette domain-containing protein [Bacteroidia bacterium]MDW8416934.1 ATP-binding cassette domain-containing protein [Bacteroidia bacterium]
MQEVLLDGLARILAYFSLQGSFSQKETVILRQLLRELGVDAEAEIQKIQHYIANQNNLRPQIVLRSISQQLPRHLRYLLYAYIVQLAYADKVFQQEEERFLKEMAEEFEIPEPERYMIELFAQASRIRSIDSPQLLIVGAPDKAVAPSVRHMQLPLPGYVAFLYLPSVGLLLMRLVGPQMEAHLNGQWIHGDVIRVFVEGSLLRIKGYTLTYKEVLEQFQPTSFQQRLLWEVRRVSHSFKEGRTAIHPVSFEVVQGRLVGIMGPSGAGKSTLLRILSGQQVPTSGKVYLNGKNIHTDRKAVQGLLGFVPQDDLLIEELTVWENVYYAARLAYRSDKEARESTEKTLKQLGLMNIAHLPVGSPLNPTISGGQRKRVNIALELVRGPLVLFVDEPTSGLSSSDAVQVVELLQALARDGRIVFFTLHQPSSEIYKKLDHLLFLDEGGYTIFWGSPIAALQHFRRAAGLAESEQVECPSCRRVEPESLFDIIQQRRIDEAGNISEQRHVPPEKWYQIFWRDYLAPKTQIEVPVPRARPPASIFRQGFVLWAREGLRKWRTWLSSLALIVASPLLGLIVGFTLHYHPPGQPYTLYENDNLPTIFFTNILAVIFLGMLSSAEELLRDRKIRLREAFLHLSWFSYLHAKLFWVALFSAIQVTLYWGVVSLLIGLYANWMQTWLLLYIVAILSNLLSLNLSDTFTHPVPIYVLIPILIIPQLVLSGAVIPYDKFNPSLRGSRPVPILADFSFTRWAYEAQVVSYFVNNPYHKLLYPLKARQSHLRYHLLHELPMRRENGDTTIYLQGWKAPSLDSLEKLLQREMQAVSMAIVAREADIPSEFRLRYHNDAVERIALASQTTQKILYRNERYYRMYEPALITECVGGGYEPFFSAVKCIAGKILPTPVFNQLILLLMGFGLWLLLVLRVLNYLFLGGKP